MREILRVWKYALGSFNDEKTQRYDNAICIIRSVLFFQLFITNCFIVSNTIRHWNDNVESNTYNTESRQHNGNHDKLVN